MSTKNARALAFFELISEEDQTYKCKLCVNKTSGKTIFSGKKSQTLLHIC